MRNDRKRLRSGAASGDASVGHSPAPAPANPLDTNGRQ